MSEPLVDQIAATLSLLLSIFSIWKKKKKA
jgi:hypothetical protein